ncbi:MAG: hypothetical protein WA066_01535 [Candidatus Omnitrophota bacterium]
MREIWDEEKKLKKEKYEKEQHTRQQGRPVCFLSGDRKNLFQKHFKPKEKQFIKIRKYYFEHLELKKAALDFFPKYEEYLGKAGFSKV